MILLLYQHVFGKTENTTNEDVQEFAKSLAVLPDGIFNVVYQYYICHKSKETLATEQGQPIHIIEQSLTTGITLLRLFNGVQGQPGQ